jgi:hypothetical protein
VLGFNETSTDSMRALMHYRAQPSWTCTTAPSPQCDDLGPQPPAAVRSKQCNPHHTPVARLPHGHNTTTQLMAACRPWCAQGPHSDGGGAHRDVLPRGGVPPAVPLQGGALQQGAERSQGVHRPHQVLRLSGGGVCTRPHQVLRLSGGGVCPRVHDPGIGGRSSLRGRGGTQVCQLGTSSGKLRLTVVTVQPRCWFGYSGVRPSSAPEPTESERCQARAMRVMR